MMYVDHADLKARTNIVSPHTWGFDLSEFYPILIMNCELSK